MKLGDWDSQMDDGAVAFSHSLCGGGHQENGASGCIVHGVGQKQTRSWITTWKEIQPYGHWTLGPVLFSDWPAHFRDPLLDPKGPRNAKKPDLLKRKNGAPPNFVLYTVIHYYGTPKNEFS